MGAAVAPGAAADSGLAGLPILLFGAPRSGTTWLGKIFDSHPDVLYRHEPDSIQEDFGLPWICPPEMSAALAAGAVDYLERLIRTGTLKTSSVRPLFPKHYRDPLRQAAHGGLVWTLRGLGALGDALGASSRRLNAVRIPDLVRRDTATLRVVVKSVSAHGRARAFADAAPAARIVVILRDPWGYVASVLRGATQGKFGSAQPLDWIPDSGPGRRHGLTAALLAAMPETERLAWNWTAINEQLLDDLADRPNVRIVRYDELCDRPEPLARELFAFADLAWHPQTERFIARSTRHDGPEHYYGVFRDAAHAPQRWRQEMPAEDQHRIAAILRRSRLAQFCPALDS